MEDNYFLAKWLANEITDEELKELVSEEDFVVFKKIKAASTHFIAPSNNRTGAEEKLQKIIARPKVKRLSLYKVALRVAAVFALLVSVYYFGFYGNKVYKTEFAEKTSFELPDKSFVELNAGSQIEFSSKFWNKNRSVNLIGEAYFKVKKGSKFTVNTLLGNVTVLGTQFNVLSRDNYFEVTCFEGLVSAEFNNSSIKIPAGSSIKVLKGVRYFSEKNEEKNPSWIDNSSSFSSIPYKYVIKELERQYNVTITYSSVISENLFTGSFTHTDLDLALKSVSIPLNLNYELKNNSEIVLK